MQYQLHMTPPFAKWLKKRNAEDNARLMARFYRIQQGNFGDYKRLDDRLYELRFVFGGGYRVYYTLCGQTIVLLLHGGNKSGQARDIATAKKYLAQLEDSDENHPL